MQGDIPLGPGPKLTIQVSGAMPQDTGHSFLSAKQLHFC